MNINAISNTNVTNSTASGSTASGSATDVGSERNLFMTLLAAQLKNQDPLSPQDGTAFVAQLAQFNSLDQLVGIRQSIEQLNTQLQQVGKTPANTNDTTNSISN